MKLIKLSKEKFAMVDDDDFLFLSQWSWCASNKKSHGRDLWYAVRRDGYKFISMHRFLMNTPQGLVCDHVDGDSLNNQRANLQNITHLENMQRTPGWTKRKSSGLPGMISDIDF